MSKKRKPKQPEAPSVPAKKIYLYDALLFLVAVALYAPTLRYGFVGDDLIYFIGNPLIKAFAVGKILRFGATGADYLPLRDLSFALDYRLWGAHAFGFHLTNVLLYGATAVVVKRLFVRLNAFLVDGEGDFEVPAFFGALLFAIHPIHRSVVCAIYNRGALLTVLFSLLASISFLRYVQGEGNRRWNYAAALTCYVAALLSREYSLILPLVFVLIVFFGNRSRRSDFLVRTLPFFGIAAVFFILYRKIAVVSNFIPPTGGSLLSESLGRIPVALRIVFFYMLRMVTFYSGQFQPANLPGELLLAIFGVAGALSAAIALRRRPQLLFGLLFYVICLLPVMNFFKTDPIVAPRYCYLPCVGLFFAVLAVPSQGRLRLMPYLAVAFVATWFFVKSYQMKFFENNITYWESTVPYVKNPFVYRQLGLAYYDRGEYEKALTALRKVQPVPQDPAYHIVVGRACSKLKDFACAVRSFETAIKLGSTDRSVLLDLLKAKMARGSLPGMADLGNVKPR